VPQVVNADVLNAGRLRERAEQLSDVPTMPQDGRAFNVLTMEG
jgi:hypothetical protein